MEGWISDLQGLRISPRFPYPPGAIPVGKREKTIFPVGKRKKEEQHGSWRSYPAHLPPSPIPPHRFSSCFSDASTADLDTDRQAPPPPTQPIPTGLLSLKGIALYHLCPCTGTHSHEWANTCYRCVQFAQEKGVSLSSSGVGEVIYGLFYFFQRLHEELGTFLVWAELSPHPPAPAN